MVQRYHFVVFCLTCRDYSDHVIETLWNYWFCKPILPNLHICVCCATSVYRKAPNKSFSSHTMSQSFKYVFHEAYVNVLHCVEEELREVCFHCITLSSGSSRAVSTVILWSNEKYPHKIFEPRIMSLPTQAKTRSLCIAVKSVVGLHLQSFI